MLSQSLLTCFVIISVPCFTQELFEIQIVHCMLPSGKFYEKLVCLGGCWHGASMPAIFSIDWTARWCDQRPVKFLKLSLKKKKQKLVCLSERHTINGIKNYFFFIVYGGWEMFINFLSVLWGSCKAAFTVQSLCHRLKCPGVIFKVAFLRTLWTPIQRPRKKSVSMVPKMLTPVLSLGKMQVVI